MTTIQYGGGPSLEQRSAFCQLKEGAKIPGYKGFCPEYKFTFGKTFAEATSQVGAPQNNKYGGYGSYPKDLNFTESLAPVPENTGFNKYTAGMVSGYTGYIPRRSFKFGKTYNSECERCFGEHFAHLEKYKTQEDNVSGVGTIGCRGGGGYMRSLNRSDDEITDHLRAFSNTLARKGCKTNQIDAPISGYTGHIPKKDRTELGLGTGFDDATMKSLEHFNLETSRYKKDLSSIGSDAVCCCRHYARGDY